MATVDDLIALANTIPPKISKLTTDTAASHSAGQALADTTSAQAALVQQAQTNATVAIGASQSALDAAVVQTNADTKDLDDTIQTLVDMANSLKV
jgi:hypothetical protein